MSKTSRILLLVSLAVLIIGAGLFALLSLSVSGLFYWSWTIFLIRYFPLLLVIFATMSYVKFIRILVAKTPLSRNQEVKLYLLVFILLVASTLPLLLGRQISCAEVFIRGIELQPGECWYN